MRTQNLHDDFVEQVRSSSDILSVISSYVHLKNEVIAIGVVAPFTMKNTFIFRSSPTGIFLLLWLSCWW